MSRAYSMSMEIKGYNKDKESAIKNAADGEWSWEDWSDYNETLSTYGDSSLCGGESEDEFAVRISRAVWEANGGYCEVAVSQTCLEDLPCDNYCLGKEDYKKIMAE